MGVKKWIFIGGGLLITIAVVLGIKKKEDEHEEKIQRMIREVDGKKAEEGKTVEEMASDVDDAISGMDIDSDEEETVEEPVPIIDQVKEMVQEGRHSIDIEWRFGDKIKDDQEVQNILAELRKEEEAKREEYFRTEWPKEVEKAVSLKDYNKLEDLFDRKYAGGPWHPSPASVFGDARNEGVIDDAIYKGAEKYFGRLWCYSGD